jgi:hypothetical protein
MGNAEALGCLYGTVGCKERFTDPHALLRRVSPCIESRMPCMPVICTFYWSCSSSILTCVCFFISSHDDVYGIKCMRPVSVVKDSRNGHVSGYGRTDSDSDSQRLKYRKWVMLGVCLT